MIKQLITSEITSVTGAAFCCCMTNSGTVITSKVVTSSDAYECRRFCCSGGFFGALDFTFSLNIAPGFFPEHGGKENKEFHATYAAGGSGVTFGISSSTRQISRFSVDGTGYTC